MSIKRRPAPIEIRTKLKPRRLSIRTYKRKKRSAVLAILQSMQYIFREFRTSELKEAMSNIVDNDAFWAALDKFHEAEVAFKEFTT